MTRIGHTEVELIIPFYKRGSDLRSNANLDVVMQWWYLHGLDAKVLVGHSNETPQLARDLYAQAVSRNPRADVFVFASPDTLLPVQQIARAVKEVSPTDQITKERRGYTIPFTRGRYLSDETSRQVRDRTNDSSIFDVCEWWSLPPLHEDSVFSLPAAHTGLPKSVATAVTVLSRAAVDAVLNGQGHLVHSPRLIEGPAVHLTSGVRTTRQPNN
jgi:hypothetical protein